MHRYLSLCISASGASVLQVHQCFKCISASSASVLQVNQRFRCIMHQCFRCISASGKSVLQVHQANQCFRCISASGESVLQVHQCFGYLFLVIILYDNTIASVPVHQCFTQSLMHFETYISSCSVHALIQHFNAYMYFSISDWCISASGESVFFLYFSASFNV